MSASPVAAALRDCDSDLGQLGLALEAGIGTPDAIALERAPAALVLDLAAAELDPDLHLSDLEHPVSIEDYQAATSIPPVRGQSEPRGRHLSADELRSLFEACSGPFNERTVSGFHRPPATRCRLPPRSGAEWPCRP